MNAEMELVTIGLRNGGLVTDRDARRLMGWEAWQRAQDRGTWAEVAPGHFRHAARPLTFEMQVRAGAAWLGKRGALFGASSLLWLGVDVPEQRTAEFLVPRTRRSTRWLVLHTTTRWDELDVIRHGGVRCTNAARAIIDWATQGASARDLERAIDSAIRLRRTALSRLTARLTGLSGSGRRGVVMLRELLLDSGGESYLERRFLRLVRSADLPRPTTQVVFRRNGTTVARVDFLFPRTNVIVEVSGRLGHSSDSDRRKDARRRNALQSDGYEVIEFTTADVLDDPGYIIDLLRSRVLVPRRSRGSVIGVGQEPRKGQG
ncbi:MAG TPA: DUF559 domain-containing protein [Ilumatobacteraceae bacterium]|nr:DUF559 domain-containing protein [Ilumatobacteraceae bacterium]